MCFHNQAANRKSKVMEDASHRKSGFANNSSTNIEINEAGEASNIAGGNINLVQHQHNYFSPFQNRSSREGTPV